MGFELTEVACLDAVIPLVSLNFNNLNDGPTCNSCPPQFDVIRAGRAVIFLMNPEKLTSTALIYANPYMPSLKICKYVFLH